LYPLCVRGSDKNSRLPGSDQKKDPPPKGERSFLVLQRGFPLPGINFDSPGATGKNIPPPKGEGYFWCSSGDFPYRG